MNFPSFRNISLYALASLLFCGCGPATVSESPKDTFLSGDLYISCDESFKPVMDEQLLVFQSSYPDSRIHISYKPEAACLKDLLVDSIQMVIATRRASKAEVNKVSDSLRKTLTSVLIAHDLVAVLVHPSAKQVFFNMQEIKDLLAGKLKKTLIPVLDGNSATSTVRFMLDSVLRNQNFGSDVVAAQGSEGVIDYVSKTPEAVGFVGFSWIGNIDDSLQGSWRNKVKMAALESTDSADRYITPSQYFIYTNSYPMVRDLVYSMKERHFGIAHGFANFLTGQRGQLIFKRSYIMPVILPNYIRDAELTDSINKY